MTAKPTLFTTQMVRAILDGRKTQTRRVLTKNNSEKSTAQWHCLDFAHANPDRFPNSKDQYLKVNHIDRETRHRVHCKVRVGDVFWVRETFAEYDLNHVTAEAGEYVYKANDFDSELIERYKEEKLISKWKPSLHMPKAAARIFLEVTDVRVERLQDISESDAIAEGVDRIRGNGKMSYRSYAIKKNQKPLLDGVFPYVAFKTLWQSINGKESWEANPWVWVYDFKRVDKPENF